MRSDASALLEKLDRKGFDYRQFPDRYADLELWPIFEALLADPRILERTPSQIELRSREFEETARSGGHGVSVPAGHPLETQFSSLLSAYGAQPVDEAKADFTNPASAAPVAQPQARPDLRTFLTDLARGL